MTAAPEMLAAAKAEKAAKRAERNYERLCSGLTEADEHIIEHAGAFALERRQVARELRKAALAKDAPPSPPIEKAGK